MKRLPMHGCLCFLLIVSLVSLINLLPIGSAFSFAANSVEISSIHNASIRKCSPLLQSHIDSSHPDEKVIVWIFFADRGGYAPPPGVSPRAARRVMRRGSPGARSAGMRPVFRDYIAAVSPHAVRVRRTSKYFNAVSAEVRCADFEAICSLPFVASVRTVAVYRRDPPPAEIDRAVGERTVAASDDLVQTQYGESVHQLAQIQALDLLERGYNGSGEHGGSSPILIGILDSGFRRDHEALTHVNVVAEYDFIQNDTVTSNEAGDHPSQDMHGTTVLGAIAGYHEGDLIGPAWGADYILGKTEIIDEEIEIEEDNWVAGIEWMDSIGADVVTSSVGYLLWYTADSLDGNTALCTRAADIAVSRGIVVVNSAGNYGPNGGLIAPADGDSVITVGMVNRYGELAYNSSRGPTADGRIKPELVAMGVGVHTVRQPPSLDDYYGYSGTSYAAPLVAGLCAQLLEVHRDWSPMELREVLLCTATRHNYPDNAFGYGIPQGLIASGLGGEPDVLIIGYPNPFREQVNISFCPSFTNPVRSEVYDVRGALIKTLYGERGVIWDGTNESGRKVAGGVYFIVFRFKSYNKALKVLRVP